MRCIIIVLFSLGLGHVANSQKLTLDDLFKLNSKGITEIRKSLKSKGFSLQQIRRGVHGEPTYTWLSKTSAKTVYFRELDLDEESSTLSYSPITAGEYESLRKEVLKRGFKQIPYDNYDPDQLEIISYKKGKIEVNFFVKDKLSNINYSIAVSD